MRGFDFLIDGSSRRARWILVTLGTVSASVFPMKARAAPQPTDRERTFLRLVFNGEEQKAVEYAQVAGINANSIAGEPLSAWFYRDGRSQYAKIELSNLNVQKIVFERFRQNANPPNITDSNLQYFCGFAPGQSDNARQPYIQAMAAGFDSLVHYGLRDKKIVTDIFLGCIIRNAAPLTGYVYDTVITRMLRAGADINARSVSGERPIEEALKTLNADVAERLIRDGAEVTMVLKAPCPEPSNLYGYLFAYLRPRDTEPVVRIVKALSAAGLPPTIKAAYADSGGYGRCHYSSFYDAVIDTGNLDFARAIQAASSARVSAAPAATTQPIVPSPAAVGTPQAQKFGFWQTSVNADGRPAATSNAANSADASIRQLRLECVAGGKLEYVAVPAKAETIQALWVDGVDDMQNELPLVNGRVTGKAAAQLSKEFLTAEANARKDGAQNEWTMGITANDANREASRINGAGFSQARSYLLANCKN